MKKNIFWISAMACIVLTIASCKKSSVQVKEAPALKTKIDTISYLFGYSNGKNWKAQGLEDMDMTVFLGALEEAYEGKESKVDLRAGGQVVRDYIDGKRKIVADANLKKSNEFLEQNGKKDGVVTTESGLQYQVLVEGTGPKPTATDKVKVNYVGTTIDGKVFDESPAGKPYEQYVNRVIAGWKEILPLMNVGSKYKLFVPPSLAYGERGTPDIEPNSVLIFEMELVEILPNKPNPAVKPAQ